MYSSEVFKRVRDFFQTPGGVAALCLGLFALTVWTFMPALQCKFLYFDDAAILLNNPHVNTGLGWSNLYWALTDMGYNYSYPLPRISHMLDFQLYGAAPWGHHLTNVLLHAANGVLVFLVLKRMTLLRSEATAGQAGAMWRSLAVALLFALHPLRVQSVAWVSERKDVLSTFFCLLALLFYGRYAKSSVHGPQSTVSSRQSAIGNYSLALLFFICGLLSKSMLVTFPFLLLLLDYWPLERITNCELRITNLRPLLLEKIPFLALVALVSIATYSAVKSTGGQFILHFGWPMRLESAVMGYGRYLGLMIWPMSLSAIYPYPDYWPTGPLLCALGVVFGMSVVAFALRRRCPYLVTGWLWYLGVLVPVIGLIPIGGESICTRFTYIPMIGVLVMLAWGIGDLTKGRPGRAAIVTVIVALAAAACVMRTRAEIVYWKSGETLYRRAIEVTTNNFMAHYCLGEVLFNDKNLDQARDEFQAAVNINPDIAASQRALATLLELQGRYRDAIPHCQAAIRIEPENSWDYNGLATCLQRLGRAEEAVAPMLKAAEVDPHNTFYSDQLDTLLYNSRQGAESISNFLELVHSDPKSFGNYLDVLLWETNRVDLMNNLALAFAANSDSRLRNGAFAVRLARRACEITHYQVTICVSTLAAADTEIGQFDDAIAMAQNACDLAAQHGEADFLQRNQELLKFYRSHQPYHEVPKEKSP